MCGIGSYIGTGNGYKYVMYSINALQNRGYDSAGIAGLDGDKFIIKKFASTESVFAIEELKKSNQAFKDCGSCIGHTRWRTHGSKSDKNAHPHLDFSGIFALAHNGIIENYEVLKNELIELGIKFSSETDTEVIVNLIGHYYSTLKCAKTSIQKAISRLEGTWGLVILCSKEPNKLFCARHGSPLLVGFGKEFMMVSSEQSGFCKYINNYICLKNNDLIELEKINDSIVFHKLENYQVRKVSVEFESLSPDPYPHWTLKEINEQYDVALRAMGMGGRIETDRTVRLGGFDRCYKDLLKLDNLILLGCGTSFNAGLHCINTFKKISGFNTVQIFDGAKFNKYDIAKKGKTGLIIISQSGETKDLCRCISLGKDLDLFMIGVVNVVDSLIAREVDCGVYTNASKEVGVASTKVFTSQVVVLNLIAIWFAQNRNLYKNERMRIISDLRRLPIDIDSTLNINKKEISKITKYLETRNSMFVLGKGNCEAIARESALKIKEIGYIHAESYNSSSLKHGPYSLIIDGLPVIIILPNDKDFSKNYSVVEELSGRDAFIIGISDHKLNDKCHIKIKIPNNETFNGLLSAIPSQLIAYYLALLKGHNPDFPRNLAKSVTTD